MTTNLASEINNIIHQNSKERRKQDHSNNSPSIEDDFKNRDNSRLDFGTLRKQEHVLTASQLTSASGDFYLQLHTTLPTAQNSSSEALTQRTQAI